ncbi:hypothetical protein F2P56_015945 [Juglans regia]|uniref:Uncharacterized protein LOC109006686 n=2 Tax=Juglans regia TaxID=51240 RepID=A0A2I4GCF8_JUGRE|nr:uncharacterized protein LOC109006686 [Juglans regia]KAF5465986.1 hypothetical protein F2P56_015945 [Juglans regia]
MGFTMSLNLLLLVDMVATNILSLYHLSSTIQTSGKPPAPPLVPDRLTRLQPTPNLATKAIVATTTIPSDLLLYSLFSPIATSCHYHPELLHRYMNYTPFSLFPQDSNEVAESLILRGCHPLPRRQCFSKTPLKPTKPPHHDFEVFSAL